uniref:hypothetical protein n=1 Tax=Streptomyces sp. TG1A-60 TaxID=3129111 RepID=UPI00403FEF61
MPTEARGLPAARLAVRNPLGPDSGTQEPGDGLRRLGDLVLGFVSSGIDGIVHAVPQVVLQQR